MEYTGEYLAIIVAVTLASLSPLMYMAWAANRKLGIIHLLVNSTLTTALQGWLGANKKNMILMRHIVDLNKAQHIEPTVSALAEIKAEEKEIADQELDIAARVKTEATVQRTEGKVS